MGEALLKKRQGFIKPVGAHIYVPKLEIGLGVFWIDFKDLFERHLRLIKRAVLPGKSGQSKDAAGLVGLSRAAAL